MQLTQHQYSPFPGTHIHLVINSEMFASRWKHPLAPAVHRRVAGKATPIICAMESALESCLFAVSQDFSASPFIPETFPEHFLHPHVMMLCILPVPILNTTQFSNWLLRLTRNIVLQKSCRYTSQIPVQTFRIYPTWAYLIKGKTDNSIQFKTGARCEKREGDVSEITPTVTWRNW